MLDSAGSVELSSQIFAPAHGANFQRSFGGIGSGSAVLDVVSSYGTQGHGSIVLNIANQTSAGRDISVLDAYRGNSVSQHLQPDQKLNDKLSLDQFGGWYDLIVTVSGDASFKYQLAATSRLEKPASRIQHGRTRHG